MIAAADVVARSAEGRFDAVVEKVADRGRGDVHAMLGYKPLEYFGLDVTVGGLVAAVLAVVGAWLLSVLMRRWLTGYARRNPNANRASLYTVSRLVQYVLLSLIQSQMVIRDRTGPASPAPPAAAGSRRKTCRGS